MAAPPEAAARAAASSARWCSQMTSTTLKTTSTVHEPIFDGCTIDQPSAWEA